MEMLPASDRRSVRRSVDVECLVTRSPESEVLGERALDVSTRGMLVLSVEPCVVGETVLVAFRVPGTKRWIQTSARIARIMEGNRYDDPGRALGLEFERLDSEVENFLRGTLEDFLPTLPKRPMRVDYTATAAMIALDE